MADRTAIVIGVGPHEGLGAAIAKQAAAEGLYVFVAGRTLAKVASVAEAIRVSGGRATPVECDATQ